MTIEEIYESIDKIVLKHLMLNDDAMKLTQSWGYNGFKRLHRMNTKKLLCSHSELSNCMFDRYRKVLNVRVNFEDYVPTSLKSHLDKWIDVLNEDLQKLGELNYEHIKLVGYSNCVAECVMKCFIHDQEKANRWYERFSNSNWNSIEMHLVDDRLHEKMKKEEEKYE